MDLQPWGNAAAYTLKNRRTGCYLAAHPDGQLVAEDTDTHHHDLVWKVYQTQDGGVALKSCHGKFLSAHGHHAGHPNNNAQACDSQHEVWRMEQLGGDLVGLRGSNGHWLAAVPPVEGEQAVFLRGECGEAEAWELGTASAMTAVLDRVQGALF